MTELSPLIEWDAFPRSWPSYLLAHPVSSWSLGKMGSRHHPGGVIVGQEPDFGVEGALCVWTSSHGHVSIFPDHVDALSRRVFMCWSSRTHFCSSLVRVTPGSGHIALGSGPSVESLVKPLHEFLEQGQHHQSSYIVGSSVVECK